MQIGKYLRENQPLIYKTFINSLEKNKLSHAYLLVGNPGTPLKETAMYLAKSMICDEPSPLACNNCISCLRIEHNNYPDFLVFDGSKESIKKDDVQSIEAQFERTAVERKGIMVYIIHLIENMNNIATNSILKFLEEPRPNVFAFLTTNNENSILPTIISRCQVMHLKLVDRKEVIHDAFEYGVPIDDAELLSYFYNDGEMIFDFLRNDEENKIYHASKKAIISLLEELDKNNHREAIFHMQNVITPMVNNSKKQQSLRFFLDLLAQFFEDLLNIQNNNNITLSSYDTILTSLAGKLNHVQENLLEIQKQRNLVNLNLNIPLQLDHLIFEIVKE